MGRNYYCEYCDKRMKNDVKIRQQHNKGQQHKAARTEHYARFRDIETILAEESRKNPCLQFAKNQCNFGSFCRFSHYSRQEIQAMQLKVDQKKHHDWLSEQPQTFDDSIILEFLRTRENRPVEAISELWPFPDELIGLDLPLSMRPLKPSEIPSTFEEW